MLNLKYGLISNQVKLQFWINNLLLCMAFNIADL